MKILVAIPVYDGKLQFQTVSYLLGEQSVAQGLGDELQVLFLPTCSHPAMGRNRLAQDFMGLDHDRLVFLDADVTGDLGSLVKIAHAPVDFVGGAYRFKWDEESYPIGWLDQPELQWDHNKLLEVKTLPGGFLSLSRNVFQRLKEAHPEREYEHFGNKCHAYFAMPWMDGALYGEDAYFCKSWRDLGGQIFLDPMLTLTHWDFNRPFEGHIGNWLKRRNGLLPAEPKGAA